MQYHVNINRKSPHTGQRGVALVTILLVVALATITAVAMTETQQFDIARTTNVLRYQQIFYNGLGAEQWARGLLKQDLAQDKQGKRTDNLTENWSKPLPETPIDNGTISGQIEDLQGRFNINNLQTRADAPIEEVARAKREADLFKRLLNVLEIREPITDAIMDWLDTDSEPRFPDGGEDAEYLRYTPPYRSANRKMSSPTELLLVKGITPEIYAKLKPFICTLPDYTTININTAPMEIIAALSDQVSTENALSFTEDRKAKVYTSNKDFIEEMKKVAKDKNALEATLGPLIGTASQHFLVQSNIQVDTIRITLMSVIQRQDTGETRLLYRGLGEY